MKKMKIKLGIVTIDLKFKMVWNVGTEAKVVKVLKEKGRLEAVRYYRNDLNNCKIELKASKDYVWSLADKYEIS